MSDAINYGLLGRELWEHGRYALNGIPYSNHLPLHAFLSYPLTQLFGFHLGMHVMSLVGGFGVLLATYLLVFQIFRWRVFAASVCFAVLIHPSFVLMSMLGSADLLFTTLFLLSVWMFLKAERHERWYLGAGIAAGLASLTRYNGIPLFALFLLWTVWKRRAHLRRPWFWAGMVIGVALFSLWLARNFLVFGNPFYSSYTGELSQEAPNLFVQFVKNIRYYINPIHNIFPFFFVFGLWGLMRFGRRYPFLILAMITGFAISMIWWVQAIRFMFPGFVIFLCFAVLGIFDVVRRCLPSTSLRMAASFILVCGIAVQSLSLCLYTYGECNALFDRAVGILPKNMRLTNEGFYAWHLAREELNRRAEPGALIEYDHAQLASGIFRSDLRIVDRPDACPSYRIAQSLRLEEQSVWSTADYPVTHVAKTLCPKS